MPSSDLIALTRDYVRVIRELVESKKVGKMNARDKISSILSCLCFISFVYSLKLLYVHFLLCQVCCFSVVLIVFRYLSKINFS